MITKTTIYFIKNTTKKLHFLNQIVVNRTTEEICTQEITEFCDDSSRGKGKNGEMTAGSTPMC
jgi:hypothetical protein